MVAKSKTTSRRGQNGAVKSQEEAASGSSNGATPEESQEESEDRQPVNQVVVDDYITVRDLATIMDRSPIDLIKVLMQYGIMAPITHNIDHDTAVIIGDELGVAVTRPEPEPTEEDEAAESESETEATLTVQSVVQQTIADEDEGRLIERPPVVAVLGHVDHGKTTLLDRIRNTNVAEGEAGGITQRTGAYQIEVKGHKITFLDTPGHEAFTAMRSRGAQVTDIVVLVVAADDGIMPQTSEAISHARAAGVIIIVALNKVDKANANVDRVMEELSQAGLQPEDWGGDTIVVPMSALNNEGIDDLLDNILVVAELEQFRANPRGKCIGTVIESELDKYRGVTATLLVQNGTLKRSSSVVVGNTWGRVKAMFDLDEAIKEAGPSRPVVVLGLQEVPTAGEIFEVVKNDREARRIAEDRQDEVDRNAQADRPVQSQMTLEDLFARVEGGETKSLNLIIRADMQGTLEPIVQSLEALNNDEVEVQILQAAIGDISESDVMLAEASDAVIIGFTVNTDRAALARAEASGVEIRHYDIIYKMVEEIEAALTGMLDPIYEPVTIGHVQVLQLFKLRRSTIAGCSVTDGLVKRSALARVERNGVEVIPETHIDTLRRFTEDVNEVRAGFECGIKLAQNSDELREGDVIEVYESQRVR